MKKQLTEGLDYKDLVNQVIPEVEVDEYSAKMGEDDEIVTLSFTVESKQVGEDLVDWFEKGYEFVLDAQTSDGELKGGQYLVFVELNRRSSVPERIVQILEDLETLTDLKLDDWTILVDGNEHKPDAAVLKTAIILSPHEYRKINEKDLNEMRNLSGLAQKKIFDNPDKLLKDFIAKAGL